MSEARELIQTCSAKLELLASGLNPDQDGCLTLNRQALHGLFLTLRDVREDLDEVSQAIKQTEQQG